MSKDGPGGEKTEKPTPQRLKKARKEGQIPRTQELGTWLGVAAASVLLPMLVGNAFDEIQKLFVQVGVVASNPETEALSVLMGQALSAFLVTLLPMAVGMMVVGTVAAAAQGGVTFATKSMKPTLKKLNPFPGMKRMFGTQGLWEAVKALIKTAALGTVVIITSDRAQALVSSAGSLPLSAVTATFTELGDPDVPRRRRHRPGHRRRRLRRRAGEDDEAAQDEQVRDQAGAQAVRGRPAHEGRTAGRWPCRCPATG